MKFPKLAQQLLTMESHIDTIYELQKEWHLAANGAVCGPCELVVPALAKRTNAFIDAFAKMIRDDNHYAAPLFIRPTLEHVLVAIASDEYKDGQHEFALRFIKGDLPRNLRSTSGNRMTETYLVGKLKERILPGRFSGDVVELYKWSNSFVHFGTQQAFSLVINVEDDAAGQVGKISTLLRGQSYEIPNVSERNVQEWVGAMESIAILMESCLTELAVSRRNWLCQVDQKQR